MRDVSTGKHGLHFSMDDSQHRLWTSKGNRGGHRGAGESPILPSRGRPTSFPSPGARSGAP